MRALTEFGAPSAELSEADLATPGVVYQIGVSPRRVDILTDLTGLTFAEAWQGRVRQRVQGVDLDFIGREAIIQNKRATGRARDLADIEGLE